MRAAVSRHGGEESHGRGRAALHLGRQTGNARMIIMHTRMDGGMYRARVHMTTTERPAAARNNSNTASMQDKTRGASAMAAPTQQAAPIDQ